MEEKKKFAETRKELKEAYLKTCSTLDAQIFSSGEIVAVKGVTNPEENATSKYSVTYKLDLEKKRLVKGRAFAAYDPNVLAEEYSPDETKKAVVRRQKEGESTYSLEIWQDGVIQMCAKLDKTLHQQICTNGYLVRKTLQWSGDSSKIMYCAERKAKEIDIWAKFDDSDSEEKEEEKAKRQAEEGRKLGNILNKHEYQHNWGEAASNFSNLDIFVFDLKLQKVGKVGGIPADLRVIQALFVGPEGNSVVFCGICGEYPSGIVYCMNKDSSVYIIEDFTLETLDKNKKDCNSAPKEEECKKTTKISEDGDAISLYPIVSPSGNKICYLYTQHYNENHFFTTGMKVFDRKQRAITKLIDDLDTDSSNLAVYITNGSADTDFYFGVNEEYLVFMNFENAGKALNRISLIGSACRKRVHLYKDFETDSIQVLRFDKKTGGLLFTLNNFYHPNTLGYIPNVVEVFERDEKPIYIYEDSSFDSIREGDIFEERLEHADVVGYLWGLKSVEIERHERKAVLVLHGGPHSVIHAVYSHLYRKLLKDGFLLLTVNFSGSISFGKDFNERLGGNCCRMDLGEVMAIVHRLQDEGRLTKTDLHFSGGSYSGQQGVSLLHQYPHTFRSITIRNPVVNLLYKVYASDIPEHSFREGLGQTGRFDISKDLTDGQLLKLKEMSPGLKAFDPSSKTRVLLVIGDSDLRVNPRASYYLYKKLKQVGIDIKCLVYKGEGHAISRTENVFDMTLNHLKILYK